MSEFESLGLKGGIWQGVLRRETPPGRLLLVHMGEPVAEARAEPEGQGWRIAAPIPPGRLSDGAQSFLLVEDQGTGTDPVQPGARRLSSLTLVAGALLEGDMLAEMALMRAELELLKKELRRLAAG